MISPSQLVEMRTRIQNTESGEDVETLREDALRLLAEVALLADTHSQFTARITARVDEISGDLETLEIENARLRQVTASTYFERDACIGLLARLARQQGYRVGKGQFEVEHEAGSKNAPLQNRVVVDLPTGQVSWEYLQAEAHLYADLPQYDQPLEAQNITDMYSRVIQYGQEGQHGTS